MNRQKEIIRVLALEQKAEEANQAGKKIDELMYFTSAKSILQLVSEDESLNDTTGLITNKIQHCDAKIEKLKQDLMQSPPRYSICFERKSC